MDIGKVAGRGLAQTAFLIAAVCWLGSAVVLIVHAYAPDDNPDLAWTYWSTGVVLMVTLPLLIAFGRRAFRPEHRIGPQHDVDETEEDRAARPHLGLHGDAPPPTRW